MTKLLHSWEKKKIKLIIIWFYFLYIIVDLIIFLFLVYKYCSQKGIMRGGGENTDILNEFKGQDFMVKELSDSPLTQVVGEKLKEKNDRLYC